MSSIQRHATSHRRMTCPCLLWLQGKAAYLQWREDLKQMHARTTGEVMRAAGYPEASVLKTEALILKK